MLTFLIVAAVAYVFYYGGVRLQVRAHLSGRAILDVLGYASMLGAGTTLGIYGTLALAAQLAPQSGLFVLSCVSTAVAIAVGEFLYARSFRLSLQLLAPLRSEKSKR
ncbi:hypothetical protein JJB07_15080 [Tumebacillus sp. ITR2]|uniref:Uncharacterized protein n=1 Tax=Tumebacillus amylolyticus TaxID=2801339 RepID=A0ABS1JCI1_9BACL|nr:hypothetical protein [Tumebacillus amylolyticus]MBL0387963.1 hypothetical protein [Tumebacillus amylolyticus]